MYRKTKKKNCLKKNIIFLVFGLIICLFLFYFGYKLQIKYIDRLEKEKYDALTQDILSHYGQSVKVIRKAKLYIIENSNYVEFGSVNKDTYLTLDNIKINYMTKYFPIKNIGENVYINYNDVISADDIQVKNDRYKNYIPFNENIITNDKTSFYDEDDNFVYTLNKSFNLPIIIKDDNKYGVDFDNELLYIKENDIKEIVESKNTDKKNSTGIPVLNYHFVYEDGDRTCNEIICHSASQIKEHFSYIKDNEFFTPTMKELELYIDKKLQLPKKSVVITFDDGTLAHVAKKYVDEYKINATLFLITSWFNKEQFESEYFEIHSHGDNIHNGGMCPGGQGGAIKCMEHDKLLADLKKSRQKLGGSTVFCYPFYEYNDYSIEVLKEAGFTMAFAGEYAGGLIKVVPGIDKFRLPRWVIVNYTTIEKFISYVNGGS